MPARLISACAASVLLVVASPNWAQAQTTGPLAALDPQQQQAVNGFLRKQADRSTGTSAGNADAVLRADLNADGQPELVLLWTVSFGNSSSTSVTVLGLAAGRSAGPARWRALATVPVTGLADGAAANSGLAVAGPDIRLGVRQAAPGDPRCCPSRQVQLRWRWQNGALVAAGA